MFPFDDQSSKITLGVPSKLKLYINIILNNTLDKKPITLTQYEYLGLEFDTTLPASDEISIKIKLDRIYTTYLFTTFLPTICLVAMAELTLFINVKHFEATIMVSLTCMLVMYTLYQSISNILPHTAYMKMIDIWLLAGLILPFFIFICLIIIDYQLNNLEEAQIDCNTEEPFDLKTFIQRKDTKDTPKCQKWLKLLFPIITFFIVVVLLHTTRSTTHHH
jgi:hypothetical protein